MARRTSSSLTKSTGFDPFALEVAFDGAGAARSLPFGAAGLCSGVDVGAVYILPGSLTIGGGGSGDDGDRPSTPLPARNRSTIAAISCRLILPPAIAGSTGVGCGAALVDAPNAGRTLFTGLVSNATRLMSIKCSGPTLSDVTFPPHEPHPSVIDGGNEVEKPIAPWVVGVLTVIREAGMSDPN